VLELTETGDYLPVEVMQTSELDSGSFQLHQGLQRRVVVNLTHSSGEALQWEDVSGLRIGRVQLIDHSGKVPDMGAPSPDIALKAISKPTVKKNSNGTTNVTIIGQWDSSLHNSVLLDRITADKYRVQMRLSWDIVSGKVEEPMAFSFKISSQILSRSYVRQMSMFASLFQTVRIVHSVTAIFSLSVRPTPVKRVGDLWRMNTQYDYVKGEDGLTHWMPRGVSLVHDFIGAKRRRRRLAALEAAKAVLSPRALSPPKTSSTGSLCGAREEALLRKYLKFWTVTRDPVENLLHNSNTEPPADGISELGRSVACPRLMASVAIVAKNVTVLKAGYLFTPSVDSTRWIRRFVQLRRPYLHIHSMPDGEEVNVVSLQNSRVDHRPQIAQLLRRGRDGKDRKETVFAIYGTNNAWLFAARSEREKIEWIFKIDQAYFGTGEDVEA
jgi:kinesin family protein 1